MLNRGVTIFPDNLAMATAGEVSFAHRQGLFEAMTVTRSSCSRKGCFS